MKNKFSNTLWGLFLVLVGVIIAGNVLDLWTVDLFFDGWWTFIIIIPCLISMIQNGFGVGATTGFIIGVLLFLSYYVDIKFNLWSLVLPAALIIIGIRIVFQGAFRKRPRHFNANVNIGGSEKTYQGAAGKEYSAVFSSNRIHITEPFNGTEINAIFGGLVLDLRDAKILNDVEVNATAVFGGIDVYLPAGVNVKTNSVPIFGGVSNKAHQNNQPDAPTIYLNATCMFGGIDIK